MSCPAVQILTRVQDLLLDLDTLEERRAVKAAQQARYRARRKAGGPTSVSAAGGADATERVPPVDTTARVDTTKEEEKGKETFPPAPPIEKRAKGEEKAPSPTPARARAREGIHTGPSWKEVERYAKRAKIDTEYALWWFDQLNALEWCDPDDITQPVGNWRTLLRTWWKLRAKNGDDWKRPAAAIPRRYAAADWTLCAERCANCHRESCTCGIMVPPACEAHPRPPEECAKFAARGS